MRLSTRGRYAVMALVELAARMQDQQSGDGSIASCAIQPKRAEAGGGRPVSLGEIAQAQLLSVAYLEQLFARLRRAGLVASARGPGGGYRLARAADEISIGAIIEAVDEPIVATRCGEGTPGCLAGSRCLTHDLWDELGAQISLFLCHISLADVVEGRVCGRALPPRTLS
ncbi:Rrf2 family transcriptional regulator [Roseomonas sp. M0104]|uniref:Rrf2 family transcriptional regulator n=1 Tax=Teichococcus coralli TaxID=2545983 RepID=A0A845BAZ5_9PROT|nr:Rrf2 family transcriptional regulator [Pseudoroseomonas coralli]MXP63965.1 Rrf2 family transcriptional regulator [Pseudoroseomonas coralli]